MAIREGGGAWNEEFWIHAGHSLTLSGLAATLALIVAVFLAYGLRLFPAWSLRIGTQLAVMGYAIPGAVIAVGILVPLGWLDNQIDSFAVNTFNISTGLVLSGTIFALIYAYLVRFLAVSFNAIEANLLKIRPSLDEAARSLGKTAVGTLISVHLPLMTTGLLTAAMMVFVDVMKELPATLVIRPFNFDTLAIQVYRLASDERLSEAAGGALAIVGVGLIPVLWLSWQIHRAGYASTRPNPSSR
jgi:iron(III) transport system permease protein